MIDERIVNMVFNNQQFEKGIQQSTESLNKLDESLRLDGAGKGLRDLDAAARSFSLEGMANGVDFIASKFSMLGMMGMRAMQEIADTAIRTGKKMIDAFTIDPIKTGFEEYETQINAVQTILANTESKGTTIDDVNQALDELNTYADKTIYNFTQMTRNIGTFTAAGLDLKTSTSAIQGIANLAAVSGSNAQQASTAMYQLSQALSSGTVKLQDWNSVVNAGMGGQVFQDALKKTSAHMNEVAKSVKNMSDEEKAAWATEKGYNEDQMRRIENYDFNVDELIKKNGSFRESLSSGWITAEVLSETLNKMTKTGVAEYLSEVTGVTQEHIEAVQKDVDSCKDGSVTYEKLAEAMAASGKITKEEAESLLKMADTAEDAATKVKTFSQLLDTLKEAAQSGWTQSWETIVGDFEEAKELLTEISDIFSEIINKSSEERNSVLLGWKKAGGRDDLIQGFRNILDFILQISDVADKAYHSLFPGNRFLGMDSSGLAGITKRFAELTSNLKMDKTSIRELTKVFRGLTSVLSFAGDLVKAFVTVIGGLFGSAVDASGGLLKMAGSVGAFLTKIYQSRNWTETFVEALEFMVTPVKILINLFKDLTKYLVKTNAVTKTLGAIGKVASKTAKFASALADGFSKVFTVVKNSKFGTELGNIKDSMKQFDGMKAVGNIFTSIANGISSAANTIANSKFGQAIKNFDFLGTIQTVFDGIGTIFGDVANVLKSASGLIMPILKTLGAGISKAFERIVGAIDGDFIDNMSKIVNEGLLVGIATGIGKLIGALTGATDNAGGILEGLSDVFGGLGDTIEAFQQKVQAGNLKTIATSIAILAGSLVVLAMVDPEKLLGAVTSITFMFGELIGSLAALKGLASGKKIRGVDALVASMKEIATALLLLSIAVKIMGSMNFADVATGLFAVAVGIGLLVGASLLLSNFSGEAQNGVKGMLSLAIAVGILALALKAIGGMEWEQLNKGIVGITTVLAELMLFIQFTDLAKMGISTGLGILAMAAGIVVLAGAVALLGSLDGMTIVKGLLAMAGALLILSLAVEAMPPTLPLIGLGLIAISVGLLLMAGALAAMGSMSWEQIGKSMVTLAASLTILAVAVNFMTTGIVGAFAMLVMSAALVVLAGALLIVSAVPWSGIVKGLIGFVGAILVLAVAGAVLGVLSPLLLAAGGALIVFGLGVISAGKGIAMLAAGIAALGVAFASLVGSIAAAVDGIFDIGTNFIDGIKNVITSILNLITESAPALADAINAVIEALADIVVNGLKTVLDMFGKLFGQKLDFGDSIRSLGAFAKEIAPQLGDIIKLGTSIKKFSDDAKSSAAGIAKLADSFKKLSDPAERVTTAFGYIQGTISKFSEDAISSVETSAESFRAAGENAAEKIMEGFGAGFGNVSQAVSAAISNGGFKDAGKSMLEGIVIGMNDADTSEMNTIVDGVINGVASYANSKQNLFVQVGDYYDQGLAIGISTNGYKPVLAAAKLGQDVAKALKNALGVNSPSKVAYGVGSWTTIGLANALVDGASEVYDAGYGMGESTSSGISDALSSISDIIDSNLDYEPTITPVLDLSDVERGYRELDSINASTLAMDAPRFSKVEEVVTVNHTFDDITIRGVNSKEDFVAVANYTIDKITNTMRRQSRR